MVYWNEEQISALTVFQETGTIESKKYRCLICRKMFSKDLAEDGKCPICGNGHLEEVCPLDHCQCNHENQAKIEFCPICGRNICPLCGSHDVVAVSRVTGYYADVMGWNRGKQQELRDRVRTSI